MIPRWKQFALAKANSMFHDFYDHPEWKGENFTWEHFPEMVARMAECELFLYYSDSENKKKDWVGRKAKTKELARVEATRLVRKHGLVKEST